MIDPSCLACTPSLCTHGEQSPSGEDVERDDLRQQLVKVTGERDELQRRLSTLQAATLRAWRQSRPPPRPAAKKAAP